MHKRLALVFVRCALASNRAAHVSKRYLWRLPFSVADNQEEPLTYVRGSVAGWAVRCPGRGTPGAAGNTSRRRPAAAGDRLAPRPPGAGEPTDAPCPRR